MMNAVYLLTPLADDITPSTAVAEANQDLTLDSTAALLASKDSEIAILRGKYL